MKTQAISALHKLANKAKLEIALGDDDVSNAEVHYALAGKALMVAKREVGRGNWLGWLKLHQIGERRAQEVMAIAKKKKTVKQIREGKRQSVRSSRARNQSALRSADCGDACDFDWKNVTFADFGDPSIGYRNQAVHYRNEALHLAAAYPLLRPGVRFDVITAKEIQAVADVANAWSDVVNKLRQLTKTKEVAS